MGVWIFQANPKRYDIQAALNDPALHDEHHWTISQHKNEIQKGDLCLIWKSGKPDVRGVYALGRIMGDKEYIFDSEEEIKHWRNEKDKTDRHLRVTFSFVKKFSEDPILIDEIKSFPELRNLAIIRQPQCSNSPVSASEWGILRELIGKRKDPL